MMALKVTVDCRACSAGGQDKEDENKRSEETWTSVRLPGRSITELSSFKTPSMWCFSIYQTNDPGYAV